jgi:NAD(P)-dependent dehydrogenase (short-subunit alcohol dehydrogenase family)
LDTGTYTWENPDNKYAGVEIPGNDEYIVWNEVIVGEIIEPDEDNFYDTHQPVERIGLPEEVAELAIFLMSDAANYIVGQTIVCDGGYTLKA